MTYHGVDSNGPQEKKETAGDSTLGSNFVNLKTGVGIDANLIAVVEYLVIKLCITNFLKTIGDVHMEIL